MKSFNDLIPLALRTSKPPEKVSQGASRHVTRRKAYTYTTLDEWKEICAEVHDGFYDYSKVVECQSTIPVEIGCPDHGEFRQRKYNHMQGQKCPECAKEQRRGRPEILIAKLAKVNPTIKYIRGFHTSRGEATFKCALCDHEWAAKVNTVAYHGGKCPNCKEIQPHRRKDNKESYQQKLDVKKNGIFTLIGKYSGCMIHTNFKCNSCGKTFNSTPSQVLNSPKHCPHCLAK